MIESSRSRRQRNPPSARRQTKDGVFGGLERGAEKEDQLLADIGFLDIVWYIIAGLIIGALARLILPGKQAMSIWMTILLGVVAAIIGGLIWNAIFPGNEGIAWIGSIIVAVLLLVVYERLVASGRGRAARY
jgi:uncharacterized membrane protein YeaQ/YmgE (transglycosylase-associated protein family)